jgi:hypothetical protein
MIVFLDGWQLLLNAVQHLCLKKLPITKDVGTGITNKYVRLEVRHPCAPVFAAAVVPQVFPDNSVTGSKV